jgi:hypothetical protein
MFVKLTNQRGNMFAWLDRVAELFEAIKFFDVQ